MSVTEPSEPNSFNEKISSAPENDPSSHSEHLTRYAETYLEQFENTFNIEKWNDDYSKIQREVYLGSKDFPK
jgi:hypothetical protein